VLFVPEFTPTAQSMESRTRSRTWVTVELQKAVGTRMMLLPG